MSKTRIEQGIYKHYTVFIVIKGKIEQVSKPYDYEKSAMRYIRNHPEHAPYIILPTYFNCNYERPAQLKLHRQINKIKKSLKGQKIIIKKGKN